MSEFSLASTTAKKKTHHLSSLLLSDFMLFCSFILSHPLYFSYFIFFSPYLFKIFSFLSPLFVTTTLLLLAFFTLTPSFVNQAAGSACHLELPESKVSFLLTTYQTLVETLRSKVDYESDGFGCLEELEAYKIVFESSTTLEIREIPDEVLEMESKEDCTEAVEAPLVKGPSVPETLTSKNLDEKPAEIARPEANQVRAVVKLFEDFLQEKEGVENLSSKKREKEVKSLISVESNKGDQGQKEEEFMRSGSKASMLRNNKISELPKVSPDDGQGEHAAKAAVNFQRVRANWSGENDGDNYNSKVTDNYQTVESSTLGNFGSMRKEKEWRRTLACKLFEERHNVDGGEGMDLLWETYETDSNKVQLKNRSRKARKGGMSNENYDDEDEYEEDSDGQLCCLQALKFSAGKMNLGMGRPNLLKISKALKGIGWLHQVSSRHGKKGYR